jgi:hypothetical protein
MLSTATNGGSLTTTTSYQDVPNLTFPVLAGATYRFSSYLVYQASTTAAIFQPTMGGTCTATAVVYQVRIQTNVNGASNSQVQNSLAFPSGAPAGSAPNAASTNYGATVDGTIVVSAAGTLTVQAKHGGAACTVQAGGLYLFEQIA